MHIVRVIALAAAIAACSPPPPPAAQQIEAPASGGADVANKPDAAPEPSAAALTPAMLVGRWGDNGDCTHDINIAADGTFRSYTGNSGTWRLDGGIMSMTGAQGTFQVRVDIINGNTLMIANPDGSFGTSQRC